MTNKPKAILSCGLHRTSSDLKNLLHYFADEPITVLLPVNFYDKAKTAGFAGSHVQFLALKQDNPNSQQVVSDYEQKIKALDLSTSIAAEYSALIKELLVDRLPLSISILDGLADAKQNYDLRLLIINNEAFIHERLMRDWCSKENIPTLHVNHGVILGTPGGAYWEFATDVLSTACPNELDFFEEAFSWQTQPPKVEINGLPSWDKYALVQTPSNKEAFLARHGLQEDQPIITFFPTMRNTTYLQHEKQTDPHLTGIQAFIEAAGQVAVQHPNAVFIIKDRPGHEKYMQDYVAIQAQKAGLNTSQLMYVFDYAEPYVAFSTVTLATKSTIASESIICQVPHINLIDSFNQALAYDPEINMAHVHTSELADYLDDLLINPSKLQALQAAQMESNALTGPGRDFCSSLRVARTMAELMGEASICQRIDADLAAWQVYLRSKPNLTAADLLEDGTNPLRFHWHNVASLLQFDHRFEEQDAYVAWLQRKAPLEVDGQLMGERLQKSWSHQPSFHLIFIVDASLFSALADSLTALDDQIYKLFGISIISPDPCPDAGLLDLPNVQWVVNSNPFEDINNVIDAVASDWVLLLLPGDELMPDALFNLADYANLNRDWLALYGDEDTKEQAGTTIKRSNPYFKPDFNLELLRSSNYTGHLVAFRKDAIQAMQGFTSLPYVQSEDLLLRIAERMTLPAIGHVPFVTSHRNPLMNELMADDAVQAHAYQVRLEHLQRCGFTAAQLGPGLKPGTWQISYPLPAADEANVAILLPVLEWHAAVIPCIESLLNTTNYPNFTVYVAMPKALQQELSSLDIMQHHRLVLNDVARTTSRLAVYQQLAALATNADYLCLLEADTHFVQANWLERLLMHAQRPEVGMVAPRLVTPAARIFSAGQILGMNGDVDDLFRDFHLEQDLNNLPRAWCDQNFSALNPSCVLLKNADFKRLQGLDARFSNYFYLTDLGLRMQLEGLRLHWTPYATVACQGWLQQEVKPKYRQAERAEFLRQWFDLMLHDPSHSLNLQLRDSGNLPDFNLATAWHPVYRQQLRVQLVPLYVDSKAEKPIANLGYHLSKLEQQEQLRLGVSSIDLFADDFKLPHLFEIARQDADVILLVGEEKGLRQGLVAELKQHTNSALVLVTDQPIAATNWANQPEVWDGVISSAVDAAGTSFYLPLIEEGQEAANLNAADLEKITNDLHQALLNWAELKKTATPTS